MRTLKELERIIKTSTNGKAVLDASEEYLSRKKDLLKVKPGKLMSWMAHILIDQPANIPRGTYKRFNEDAFLKNH